MYSSSSSTVCCFVRPGHANGSKASGSILSRSGVLGPLPLMAKLQGGRRQGPSQLLRCLTDTRAASCICCELCRPHLRSVILMLISIVQHQNLDACDLICPLLDFFGADFQRGHYVCYSEGSRAHGEEAHAAVIECSAVCLLRKLFLGTLNPAHLLTLLPVQPHYKVPYTQPERAFDMVTKFIHGEEL